MAAEAARYKAAGNASFSKGDYHDAVRQYSQAIELDPSKHVYFSNRAMARLKIDELDGALSDGKECVKICPTFWKGHARIATALKDLGDYEEALTAVNAGLRACPNQNELMDLRNVLEPYAAKAKKSNRAGMSSAAKCKSDGNDKFKNADYEGAIVTYTRGIARLGPSETGSVLDISLHNNRAACYQQISNHSAMVQDASHVLELDPRNQKALLRRALGLEALERYRSALQDIRSLLAINPNVPTANAAQHRIGQTVRLLKKQKAAGDM
jgi:stress-induced-phosphoprotein 1